MCTELVQVDVVLHEGEHGLLVGDVDWRSQLASTGSSKPDESTPSSKLHAKPCISTRILRNIAKGGGGRRGKTACDPWDDQHGFIRQSRRMPA